MIPLRYLVPSWSTLLLRYGLIDVAFGMVIFFSRRSALPFFLVTIPIVLILVAIERRRTYVTINNNHLSWHTLFSPTVTFSLNTLLSITKAPSDLLTNPISLTLSFGNQTQPPTLVQFPLYLFKPQEIASLVAAISKIRPDLPIPLEWSSPTTTSTA